MQKAYTGLSTDIEEKVKGIEIMKTYKISIEAEREKLFNMNNEFSEKIAMLEEVEKEYIKLKQQYAELEEGMKEVEILRSDVTSFRTENEKLLDTNKGLNGKIVSLEAIECQYIELKMLHAQFEERIKDNEILKSEVALMKVEHNKLLNTNSCLLYTSRCV